MKCIKKSQFDGDACLCGRPFILKQVMVVGDGSGNVPT